MWAGPLSVHEYLNVKMSNQQYRALWDCIDVQAGLAFNHFCNYPQH